MKADWKIDKNFYLVLDIRETKVVEADTSQAGFCLNGIPCNLDALSIQITGCACVLAGDRVVLKVDSVPFQPQHLL